VLFPEPHSEDNLHIVVQYDDILVPSGPSGEYRWCSCMIRTDDILELLTSLARLCFDRPHHYPAILTSPFVFPSMFANSLFASIPRYPILFSCWDWHFAVIALGAGHIIYSLRVTMSFIRFAASQTRFARRSGLPPPACWPDLLISLFICHLPVPFIPSDVSPSIDIVLDLASSHLPRLVRF
jgi:hypothetical protein